MERAWVHPVKQLFGFTGWLDEVGESDLRCLNKWQGIGPPYLLSNININQTLKKVQIFGTPKTVFFHGNYLKFPLFRASCLLRSSKTINFFKIQFSCSGGFQKLWQPREKLFGNFWKSLISYIFEKFDHCKRSRVKVNQCKPLFDQNFYFRVSRVSTTENVFKQH